MLSLCFLFDNNHLFDVIIHIVFSTFSGGRYLCSGSYDKTIRCIRCVAISPLQSAKHNKNDNESNSIGVIGGNGYTICSGSDDKTIRIWDIEKTKQLIEFKGHENTIISVKYGPNKSGNSGTSNTILSGSWDKSICLWDIRSSRQIQVFNGHNTHLNKELHVMKENNNQNNGIQWVKFIKFKNKSNNFGVYLYYGTCEGIIRIWGLIFFWI
ncbi:hypothetical protein RFI_31157 [Reticulomyxa filosa]|uniref:Uncharacterized protein n=1 Tax=Reticulomyxa filosa TaxID=46433 RepID=X6LX89_RETFI|nr:hypothetical protein RFI_31157 [Reticulomyxa filosa]|eukprot:ETO06239.1 hypothetical protein RFI_31157 [Reticulomyxa filosa]